MNASTPSPADQGRQEAEVFTGQLRNLLNSVPHHATRSLIGRIRLSAVLLTEAVRLLESKADAALARTMLQAMLAEGKPVQARADDASRGTSVLGLDGPWPCAASRS